MNGDGSQTRDFTYVATVVAAISDAIHRRVAHDRPVNLAFGSRVSLRDLIHLLERILGTGLPIDHKASRPGDARDSQADSSLLRSLFPGLTTSSLLEGLTATVEWHRLDADLKSTQRGSSLQVRQATGTAKT